METQPLIAPVIDALREHHPNADIADINRAFEVARTAHTGQTRKSGEDYITHPVAVTQILAELGLNEITLIASLLHDTVEDTPYSLTQLRADFGDEIANLVDGVTKLDKLPTDQQPKPRLCARWLLRCREIFGFWSSNWQTASTMPALGAMSLRNLHNARQGRR